MNVIKEKDGKGAQKRSGSLAVIDREMAAVGFQAPQKSSINFALSLDKSCGGSCDGDDAYDLSQRIEEFKNQNPEDVEELKRCIQDVLGEAEKTAQEKIDKKAVSGHVFDRLLWDVWCVGEENGKISQQLLSEDDGKRKTERLIMDEYYWFEELQKDSMTEPCVRSICCIRFHNTFHSWCLYRNVQWSFDKLWQLLEYTRAIFLSTEIQKAFKGW